jgi:hypothetical protein
MPIKSNVKTRPSDLIVSNNPQNGNMLLYNNGEFQWATNDTGEAMTQLSDFISDTKRVGMVDRNQTATPYITDDNIIHLDDTGSGWNYYVDGERVEQSGDKTLEFNNTTAGIRWFYINDETGEIKTKTSTVDFGTECAIAYCLINPTMPVGQKCLIGDERHTTDWDSSLHVQQHLVEGTKKVSGGTISGYTLYSGTDAHKQYSISESVIYDEDIRLTLDALVGGNGAYTNFYRSAAGVWGWQLGANFPFRYTASGRMNYDNATANGSQSATNRFINTYVLLTNLTQAPQITITSQTTYETYGDALGESLTDLDLTGLSIPEFVCVYKITWYTDDSISGTGKCYIYNIQDYSVNAIDVSLKNISNGLLANTIQVTVNGNDTNADGSILKPFKTVQAAINKSQFGNYIQLGVGQFNENLTINGISNLFIQSLGSTDSYATAIASSGNLTITGSTTTRIRHRDLQFNGKLTIDGTQGRHYFDNVYFGQGADFINAIQRWHEFNTCTIDGNINIGVTGTPTAGTSIRFRNCTFGGIITISSSNVTVIFDNCRGIKLVHNAGTVIFLNENTFLKDGSGNGITSTATNANPANVIIMNGCNMQQTDLSFAKINKTGNCPYILGNSNRDINNDTLTGSRLNYTRNGYDIGYKNTTSGLTATNIQAAIDELKAMIDGLI